MSHCSILETKVEMKAYGNRNYGIKTRVQLSFSKKDIKITNE